MSELGYWTKTTKLNRGILGTALAAAMTDKKQRKLVYVGILTVSDSSDNGLNNDIAGQKVQSAIDQMKSYQVIIKIRKIVPCNFNEISNTLKDWSDGLGLDMILTIGGADVDPRHVTPEATRSILDKEVTGISIAMTVIGLRVDPNAILFRGISGIRNNVLIINLPSSVQSASDYLNVVLPNLPNVIGRLKDYQPSSVEQITSQPSVRPASPRVSPNSNRHVVSSGHSIAPGKLISQEHDIFTSATLTSTPSHHTLAPPSHHAVAPPSHHVVEPTAHHVQAPAHHAQAPTALSTVDSGISVSHLQTPPTHHSSLTLSLDHDIIPQHGDDVTVGMVITEDELLDGDSFEGMIAKESLRVIGDKPATSTTGKEVTGKGEDLIDAVTKRAQCSTLPQVSVDKATATIFALTGPLPVVNKLYKDAFDHIVAEDVTSALPMPQRPTSAMDGYAVIAADVPGDLEVVSISEGEVLTMGKTVRINTGGIVPPGADAVIPVEETLIVSEPSDGRGQVFVRCPEPSTPGRFVQSTGSDMAEGTVIVKSGTKLSHLEIGLLASVGVQSIRVYEVPTVAVISFGAKLREPDERDLSPDDIVDTNRLTLLLALKKKGFPAVDMGIVRGASELKETLVRACNEADVILTTGGAALGDNDYVKPLLSELGATLHFGCIKMKPGAPTAFATLETTRGKKFFFTLAGIPVAAYVGFYVHVLPCLRRLSGNNDPRNITIKSRPSSDIYLDAVPEYQRAKLRTESGKEHLPWADVTGSQNKSRLLSMAAANALLVLPAKTDEKQVIKRGELVDTILMV